MVELYNAINVHNTQSEYLDTLTALCLFSWAEIPISDNPKRNPPIFKLPLGLLIIKTLQPFPPSPPPLLPPHHQSTTTLILILTLPATPNLTNPIPHRRGVSCRLHCLGRSPIDQCIVGGQIGRKKQVGFEWWNGWE